MKIKIQGKQPCTFILTLDKLFWSKLNKCPQKGKKIGKNNLRIGMLDLQTACSSTIQHSKYDGVPKIIGQNLGNN